MQFRHHSHKGIPEWEDELFRHTTTFGKTHKIAIPDDDVVKYLNAQE